MKMMRKFPLTATIVIFLIACKSPKQGNTGWEHSNKYSTTLAMPTPFESVNPFIGTGGHGHTYPGATAPFGMVQLSPDTRLEGWDGCGGYHYSDSIIYGFSHTHLQGTGVPDYCDILFMPTNNNLKVAPTWKDAYKSKFKHETEIAQPGYYKVHLEDYNIDAEFTTTERTGIHKYSFAPGDSCRLFIDMMHRDELRYYDIGTIGDTVIYGYRVSKGWAEEQHCYFYAVFSKPFKDFTQLDIMYQEPDANAKMQSVMEQVQVFSLKFDVTDNVMIKVGISGVDCDGAAKNLYAEAPHWDFGKYKTNAKTKWEACLAKAPLVETDKDELAKYYTSLYHCYTVPNVWSDVDSRYRGMDKKIHLAEGYTRYTVFSLWDTFRAYHPLMSELEPERTRDWIHTFLNMYKERGELPVWELAGNETYCMIGYHSVPVIVDAYMRGIKDFDHQLALKAMIDAASGPQREKEAYDSLGYVPADMFSESVSKTLEFAYDDWCIAQFAKELGEDEIYKRFIQRAQNWKNLYDPRTKCMRPRRNGGFPEPFDPYQVDFNFTEANAWQYAYFVPQDIQTLVEYTGGDEAFFNRVDELFNAKDKTTGREQSDITGLIGQYAHGNEPSHHAAFLYNYGIICYEPSCFASYTKVQKIMKELYHNTPDGLCGNEDCGQMSAWYVLAKNNLYPICPGNPEFISFNPYLPTNHKYFLGGHEVKVNDRPTSKISDHLIIPLPIIQGPQTSFAGSTQIETYCADSNAVIVSAIYNDNKLVAEQRNVGGGKFPIEYSADVKTFAVVKEARSKMVSASFYKRNNDRNIISITPYSNQYNAGGDQALIDNIRGGNDFRTGAWQGWQGTNAEIIVDLGKIEKISSVSISCLEEIKSWIWFPSQIEILTSADGKNYTAAGTINTSEPQNDYTPKTKEFLKNIKTESRFIKIVIVPAFSSIPAGHLGMGGQPWFFVDEVVIK